jgi:DNA mismatch repair protein MutL
VIQILSENIINKIAAGEVVERPASIVKELLENCIDAGATEIKIIIEEFGLKKIQIIDNGSGIEKADLTNLFKKHATSKLNQIEDLESIRSFGFRGEALASISSVAKVELSTKNLKDEVGTDLIVENSTIIEEKPSPIQKGTSISVLNLFEKIPARKKFLKSKASENKWIMDIINKYIIANPEIHFETNIDGIQKIYPVTTFEERVAKIFRIKIEDIVTCSYDSKIRIKGFLIHPRAFFKTKANQYTFVNNRPVFDGTISKAIIDGYDTFLMKNQYPGYVIFINMPGSDVDINVHPRKSEIRFANGGEIYMSVKTSVNSALVRNIRKQTLDRLNVFDQSDDKIEVVNEGFQQYKAESNIKEFEDFLQAPNSSSFNPINTFNKNITEQALVFNQEVILEEQVNTNSNFSIDIENANQYLNSYIITTSKDSILIIDQHAASERYFYEKYLNQLKSKKVASKELLIPEIYTFDDFEVEKIEKNIGVFEELGFGLEVFGTNEIKINKAPDFMKLNNFITLFKKLADDILEHDEISNKKDKLHHEIAAILACHTAVRFGDKLTKPEIAQILKNLTLCEDPYNCPHGRPIIQDFTKYDIEKKFKRCSI